MGGASGLFSMLLSGGWAMVPLGLCSVVALAWSIHLMVRGVQDRLGRTTLLSAPLNDLETLRRQARDERSALGRVIAATAAAAVDNPGRAEEIAVRAAVEELDRWAGALQLLALIARIAPLLGLLGTVLGMVELFGSMEQERAQVDASYLSGGIWQALLTTATGLAIAIPTVMVHAWFSRRLERLRVHMESGAGRILDTLTRSTP